MEKIEKKIDFEIWKKILPYHQREMIPFEIFYITRGKWKKFEMKKSYISFMPPR
jgi:hypothetical protein